MKYKETLIHIGDTFRIKENFHSRCCKIIAKLIEYIHTQRRYNMNEREIGELRRTITPEKTGIQRIRGCLVAENREILSTFNGTLGMCSEREDEELLAIIKKTLSGTVGKNLIDIEFTTGQVLEGEEHKLLSELRSSALENDEAVEVI